MSHQDFTYAALGPWTAPDGKDYCCGRLCSNGGPCPYKLPVKKKPEQERSDEQLGQHAP